MPIARDERHLSVCAVAAGYLPSGHVTPGNAAHDPAGSERALVDQLAATAAAARRDGLVAAGRRRLAEALEHTAAPQEDGLLSPSPCVAAAEGSVPPEALCWARGLSAPGVAATSAFFAAVGVRHEALLAGLAESAGAAAPRALLQPRVHASRLIGTPHARTALRPRKAAARVASRRATSPWELARCCRYAATRGPSCWHTPQAGAAEA